MLLNKVEYQIIAFLYFLYLRYLVCAETELICRVIQREILHRLYLIYSLCVYLLNTQHKQLIVSFRAHNMSDCNTEH